MRRGKIQSDCAMRESRGGQGVRTPPPLKNHKNIGFLCTTGPDLLKIIVTKPVFNVGPSSTSQHGPLIAVFGSSFPSSTKKKKRYNFTPELETFDALLPILCPLKNAQADLSLRLEHMPTCTFCWTRIHTSYFISKNPKLATIKWKGFRILHRACNFSRQDKILFFLSHHVLFH